MSRRPHRKPAPRASRPPTGRFRAERGRKPRERWVPVLDPEAFDAQVAAALRRAAKPVGASDLAKVLEMTGEAIREVARSLRRLVETGVAFSPRPGRFLIAGHDGEFPVTVEATPEGLAARFDEHRILPINPAHALGAQTGDAAQALVGEDGQALLVRLLRRGGRELSGGLRFEDGEAFFVPDNRREGEFPCLHRYRDLLNTYRAGDRLVGEVVTLQNGRHGVKIVRKLATDSPEVADFEQVRLTFDLPGPFPAPVEAEAEAASTVFTAEGREDCRNRFIFTIDPATAKDFDDAVEVERTAQGWRLGVHVADVSHFVRPGSPLDAEASARGTSVYLVNRVIPMLPERLSNGLCSLRPDEDRYCLSVWIDLDRQGKVLTARPAATLIRSRHRLAYPQALDLIEGRTGDWPAELVTAIQECHRVAQLLRTHREREGSLNLFSVEYGFSLDVEGRPVEVEQETTDPSHQLIEEFMLLANRCVAGWLVDQGCEAVFRIHGEPDPDRLDLLARQLEVYGMRPVPPLDRAGLRQVLDRLRKEPPAARLVLNMLMLRCFQKAVYSVNNVGHYALAFDRYLHFTSPIRRYPDLLVHRLVKHRLGCREAERTEIRRSHLDALARQSSYLEQRAEASERLIDALKGARYLAGRLGDSFPAVVTQATPRGCYVQLLETGLEGMVPLAELTGDSYEYNETTQALIGRGNGRVLALGHECEVQVIAVDVPSAQVTLTMTGA